MSMPGLDLRHGRPAMPGQPSPGPVGQSAQLGNDLFAISVGKVIWLRTELKLLLNLQCCPPERRGIKKQFNATKAIQIQVSPPDVR